MPRHLKPPLHHCIAELIKGEQQLVENKLNIQKNAILFTHHV